MRLFGYLAGLGVAWLALATIAAASPFDGADSKINGINVPEVGIEAVDWRKGGTQFLTIGPSDDLLIWDRSTRALRGMIALNSLPRALDEFGMTIDRHAVLKVSGDGRFAAVTVRSAAWEPVTRLVNLAEEQPVRTLARPALLWPAASTGLLTGPRADCTTECDFALVDPATLAETSVGKGFGDGRIVAASVDGTRFATLVTAHDKTGLVVWSTATWRAIARFELPPGEVVELGFDSAGGRVFARQPEKLFIFDVDTKAAAPPIDMHLGWDSPAPVITVILDNMQAITSFGAVPLDNRLPVARQGTVISFFNDPRYGAVYDWNSGISASIGGRPADPNTFYWQVELSYKPERPGKYTSVMLHNCGGSFIRPQWVLTAAHCFLEGDALMSDARVREHILVRSGSNRLDDYMAAYDIVEAYINRCTDAATRNCFRVTDPSARIASAPLNDIALLKVVRVDPGEAFASGPETARLVRPLPSKPIDLPPANLDLPPATPVTMTGWGATSVADSRGAYTMSVDLNRIDVEIVPGKTCSAANRIADLGAGVLCAGSPNNAQIACRGDSGGPLVANIKTRPMLVGIVSYGNCAGGPAVYTRVAAFVPWIERTIAASEARRVAPAAGTRN